MDRIATESRIRREFAANRKFTPLNQPKEEILHILIAQGEITEFLPPPDPRSKRYNPARICVYHSNAPGHDTEDCWALHHKIHNLIEVGRLNVLIGRVTLPMKEPLLEAKRLTRSLGTVNPGNIVAVITSMDVTSTTPLIISGSFGQAEMRPVRLAALEPIILASRLQIPVASLKAVPWNYGEDKGAASDCTAVLQKDNPLYLLNRVMKQTAKTTGAIPENEVVEFLVKMNHNEVKVVKQLKEAPSRISILDLIGI